MISSLEELGAYRWLGIEGWSRRGRWRVRVSGFIGGFEVELSMSVANTVVKELFLDFQWSLAGADRLLREDDHFLVHFPPGKPAQAAQVLLYLIGSYMLRSQAKIRRLARCMSTASPLSPGLWRLLDLALTLAPRPETPSGTRRSRMSLAAKVVRAYCRLC